MKIFITKTLVAIMLLLLLGLFFSGCASQATDEEEGGISGTGNAINCEDEKYRKHTLCKKD